MPLRPTTLPYYSYGLQKTGEPWGLTFIARPYQEDTLLKMGFAFEQATKIRKLPEDYK
jgi:amidase